MQTIYVCYNDDEQVDSARANLASTFVNAFVNAGYGQDALITPEGNAWLYKNKDHGMMSAAASLGKKNHFNCSFDTPFCTVFPAYKTVAKHSHLCSQQSVAVRFTAIMCTDKAHPSDSFGAVTSSILP
jgi:hypothetical protein